MSHSLYSLFSVLEKLYGTFFLEVDLYPVIGVLGTIGLRLNSKICS